MSDDLARRVVQLRHWRWMPGMRVLFRGSPGTLYSTEVDSHGTTHRWLAWQGERGGFVVDASLVAANMLPDLTDPATLGCLLALVRETLGEPDVYAAPHDYGWVVIAPLADPAGLGPTEAAALVAALEAAP